MRTLGADLCRGRVSLRDLRGLWGLLRTPAGGVARDSGTTLPLAVELGADE